MTESCLPSWDPQQSRGVVTTKQSAIRLAISRKVRGRTCVKQASVNGMVER